MLDETAPEGYNYSVCSASSFAKNTGKIEGKINYVEHSKSSLAQHLHSLYMAPFLGFSVGLLKSLMAELPNHNEPLCARVEHDKALLMRLQCKAF